MSCVSVAFKVFGWKASLDNSLNLYPSVIVCCWCDSNYFALLFLFLTSFFNQYMRIIDKESNNSKQRKLNLIYRDCAFTVLFITRKGVTGLASGKLTLTSVF